MPLTDRRSVKDRPRKNHGRVYGGATAITPVRALNAAGSGRNHQGVEFTLKQVDEDRWKWQFQIGEAVKTGNTQTRLMGMAAHGVQQKIDRELKEARHLTSKQINR